MGEMWFNQSEQICKKHLGENVFIQKKAESVKQHESTGCINNFWGRSGLSLASRNASMMVKNKRCSTAPFLQRTHAVGAVGYAQVLKNPVLVGCRFFAPGNRYRVRFRHSNICCDDDAGSCIREAAIKFADRKRDGPLDLILFTGRCSLAANSRQYNRLLRLHTREQWKNACYKDPNLYMALVDGLRKGPSSYADLTYYSQICYLHVSKDSQQRIVRFRLVPGDYVASPPSSSADPSQQQWETGMLSESDQKQPWDQKRSRDDDRDAWYLRKDFKALLLKSDTDVPYRLQVQVADQNDPLNWNPQKIWDEEKCPWTDLMKIELTTYLMRDEIRKTYFNICDTPQCLRFPIAESEKEYLSLQKVMMSVQTKFERKNYSQLFDCRDRQQLPILRDRITKYDVEILSQSLKYNDSIPYVDIYITLLGVEGRTGCRHLGKMRRGNMERHQRRDTCSIESERVGELIAIIVEVEYRTLSEDFCLASVGIKYDGHCCTNVFPCHQVVTSSVNLLCGEVCLVQNQKHTVMRKERLLELCEKRREYLWRQSTDLPGRLLFDTFESLPLKIRSLNNKYTGLRWEVDPEIIDFFREFHSTITTVKMQSLYPRIKKLNNDQVDAPAFQFNRLAKPSFQKNTMRTDSKLGGMQDSRLTSQNSVMRQFSQCEILESPGLLQDSGETRLDMFLEEEGEDTVDALLLQEDAAEMHDWREPLFGTRFEDAFIKKMKPELDKMLKRSAKDNWRKVRRSVAKPNEQIMPEGSVGDMCRRLLKDSFFASLFLTGTNPVLIKQCKRIPAKMGVKNDMVKGLLDRSQNLDQEAKAGYVYIVDYELLSKVHTVHKDADHRYMCAPLVLLYVRASNDLIPLAIQLQQQPTSPVWTPYDQPAQWLLAKLWVTCADFNYMFAVSHLFNCHLLMEPFAIATAKMLPTAHPVFKLLTPHFKNTILTNIMFDKNLMSPDGAIDRHCSLGRVGFLQLMRKHWHTFNFKNLNPLHDAERRGVKTLPNYFYRDDAGRLWNCIYYHCVRILKIFYKSDADLVEDTELQAWVRELNLFGFPSVAGTLKEGERKIKDDDDDAETYLGLNQKLGEKVFHRDLTKSKSDLAVHPNTSHDDNVFSDKKDEDDHLTHITGFPESITSIPELSELLASIIFTVTCQHSATHADAMDLFGFIPDIPASMTMPPIHSKDTTVTKELLAKTLPDQYPDAYYGSLAFIMNNHKPDQNIISSNNEIYFVEEEALAHVRKFHRALCELTMIHRTRNVIKGFNYECLIPFYIPNSPEAIPYVPQDTLNKTLKDLGPTMTKANFLNSMSTGRLPYNSLALPVCMQFNVILGGRSVRGFKRKNKELFEARKYNLMSVDVAMDNSGNRSPKADSLENAINSKNYLRHHSFY